MKPGVFYDAEDHVAKAKQRIDYWLLVIGYLSFFWIRLNGMWFESVRRIPCPKLLPTRFNGGWYLLR
jgi:hypothetical protein